MAELLNVKLITPKEVVFEGAVEAVTIPSESGEMQVFKGHIPVLARIVKGIITLDGTETNAPLLFEVDEGFARITQDEVSLLIDSTTSVKA